MAKKEKNSAPAVKSAGAVKKDENKKPSLGQRIGKWFRDMKSELKKVVWPSTETLTKNTGVTLFMTVLAAVILWGFDSLAQLAVKALITLAG